MIYDFFLMRIFPNNNVCFDESKKIGKIRIIGIMSLWLIVIDSFISAISIF